MTSASTPPDDDLPRDPAFDDAWRALSSEEPPPAIDAALRAAARREVDAGPRIAVADRIATPHATKPTNWWRPLAVAATLGAIAVGLVQLVAPDRLGAPNHDAAMVSDTPPALHSESAKKREVDATSGAAAATDEKSGMLQAPAAPAPPGADRKDTTPPSAPSPSASGGMARKEAPSRGASSAFPSAPADKLPRETRKDMAAERKRDAGEGAATASPSAKTESPASAPDAEPVAPAVVPGRAAEPFPAERAQRDAATTKREASEESAVRAPAAAGVVAPSSAQRATDNAVGAQLAPDQRTAPLAKLKAAPAQALNEPGEESNNGASTRGEQDSQARVPRPSASPATAPVAGAHALAGAHPQLAVPDWIALIRRLITEGNFAAADRELAAFRAAHADARQLLPSDLRDWKPPR